MEDNRSNVQKLVIIRPASLVNKSTTTNLEVLKCLSLLQQMVASTRKHNSIVKKLLLDNCFLVYEASFQGKGGIGGFSRRTLDDTPLTPISPLHFPQDLLV